MFFGQLLPVSDLELGQNLESILVLIDCYRTEKFSSSHLCLEITRQLGNCKECHVTNRTLRCMSRD